MNNYYNDNINKNEATFIQLVKEGAPRLPCRRRSIRPLLSDDALNCARDWQFLFDVGTGYSILPIKTAATRQRPDVVIFSRSLRVDILIELTVPPEDRIAAANTWKLTATQPCWPSVCKIKVPGSNNGKFMSYIQLISFSVLLVDEYTIRRLRHIKRSLLT